MVYQALAYLVKEKKIILKAINNGGGQENNLRSGTNTLALSASLAKAIRLAISNQAKDYEHVKILSKRLLDYLKDNQDKYRINSFFEENPYIVNFSLRNHKASVVVEALSNRGIMVSSLSACHAKHEDYSAVVYAMTNDLNIAHNTIRVSFGKDNTLEEVEALIKNLESIIKEIKQ